MLETIILLLIVILLLLGAIFFFTPNHQSKNKKEETEEINNWEYQKEQARKEHEAEKNKEWFKEGRWLTDKEIDWASRRMEKEQQMPGAFPGEEVPSKFKVLPAHQFHYVVEVMRKREKGWELAFRELLKEINDESKELVFIPVNNPNFHWSLLVFEVKNRYFYHWDTLRGANWGYVKDLVYELLKELGVAKHEWDKHFLARHKVRQGNGWECGICVVGIMRRIREEYRGELKNIELGEFDFTRERQELRERYLTEK